jgi:hypothetical protein
MAEACTNGKIKSAISFHILRHTWASLALMNGTPLLVVAKNLGHADTRVVEKHYGHLAPGAPRYSVKDEKRVTAAEVMTEITHGRAPLPRLRGGLVGTNTPAALKPSCLWKRSGIAARTEGPLW